MVHADPRAQLDLAYAALLAQALQRSRKAGVSLLPAAFLRQHRGAQGVGMGSIHPCNQLECGCVLAAVQQDLGGLITDIRRQIPAGIEQGLSQPVEQRQVLRLPIDA